MSSGPVALRRDARFEAFSDGVFAIVITLLVLELRMPELHDPTSPGAMYEGLWALRHAFVGFVLCFLFVGQLWVAHTNFFRLVARTDQGVLWLNNVLLLCLSGFPFVAGLLTEYPKNAGGAVAFGILFTTTGLAFGALSAYCRRAGLLRTDIDRARIDRGLNRFSWLGTTSLVPLGLAASWPGPAIAMWFALIGAYVAGQQWVRVDADG